jgi:hypothetical protein
VKSKEYTGPAVKLTFVPKGDGSSQDESAQEEADETIAVDDRGVYRLALRERTKSEKVRYKLLGY